jgi:hypothetical protein
MSKYSIILASWGKALLQPKFFRPGKPLNSMSGEFEQVQATEQNVNMSTSPDAQELYNMFDLPVWADVKLQDNALNPQWQIQLLWCIITVSMKKNIVKTAIQGRNGTVKEYVSDGDYDITLEGGLFSENPNDYPYDKVKLLATLLQMPAAITMVSEYAQLFGIHNIVIEDFEFKQEHGKQNVQLFRIKAVSDEPIELVKES